MGVNVGRDLEGIIPRSYIQARYSFAVVERVEDLNLNRSNADWEFGYYATDRVSLRVTGAWQKTYGGIRFPIDNVHPHFHELHDRASNQICSNRWRVELFLTKSLDLQQIFSNTVAGSTTHGARGLSLVSFGDFHEADFVWESSDFVSQLIDVVNICCKQYPIGVDAHLSSGVIRIPPGFNSRPTCPTLFGGSISSMVDDTSSKIHSVILVANSPVQ